MASKKNSDNVPPIWHTTCIRFLKGGLSGFVSGTILQPLSVIKTSMQVTPVNIKSPEVLNQPNQKKHLTFMNATRTIYQNEGFPGFLRGLWPSLVKNTLTSGTYFSMLFFIEEHLKMLGLLSVS